MHTISVQSKEQDTRMFLYRNSFLTYEEWPCKVPIQQFFFISHTFSIKAQNITYFDGFIFRAGYQAVFIPNEDVIDPIVVACDLSSR